MKRASSRIPKSLIAFGIVGALFAGVLGYLDVRFETNDDIAMAFVASGFYTGEPSERLIFTNISIGVILRTAYTYSRLFPWYASYLILTLFFSNVLFLHSLLRVRRDALGVLVFGLLFFLFTVRQILFIQFTTVSIASVALCLSSLLLLPLFLVPATRRDYIVRSLVLLFAMLIRFESMLLALMLGAAVALYMLVKTKRIALLAAVAVAVLGAGVLWSVDSYVYSSDSDWKSYGEYKSRRKAINNSPASRALSRLGPDAEILKSVGWSANDLLLYRFRVYLDDETYSVEALNGIAEHFGDERKALGTALGQIRSRVNMPIHEAWIFAVCAFGLILLCRQSRVTLVFLTCMSLATLTLALLYMLTSLKLPDRVLYPALFATAIYIVTPIIPLVPLVRIPNLNVPLTGRQVSAKRKFVFGCGAALLLSVVFSSGLHYRLLTRIHRETNWQSTVWVRYVEVLNDYSRKSDEPALFIPLSSEPIQWANPFSLHRGVDGLNVIPGGWMTNSPIREAALVRHEIEDLPEALLNRADLHIVMSSWRTNALSIYFLEHRGIDPQFEATHAFGGFPPPYFRNVILALPTLATDSAAADGLRVAPR